MNRSVFPSIAPTVAAAAFALALAAPAAAVTVTLPNIQVIGAESICSSFSVSKDATGGTVLTCIPSSSPPPANAPQGCTAKINNSTTTTLPSSGGSVSLTVSCTSTVTGYSWSRNGVFGANANQNWNDTLPSNTTASSVTTSYQVKVCNGTDCVTVPTTPLTAVVQGSSTSSNSITCANKVLDVDWNNEGRYFTYNAGGFAPTDVLVVRFKTGSVPFGTASAKLAGAEYGSSPSQRIWTLSATPCDFTSTGKARLAYNLSGSTTITAWFGVGLTEGVVDTYYPQLQVNKVYYLNIKNKDGAVCFTSGGCDMFIDFSKPPGT
jgi:hypothetical protein